MAYMCTKSNKECDGCQRCKPDADYVCHSCKCDIFTGERRFDFGDRVYCARCTSLAEETEK